jgi:manganese efflux pump family protein
MRVDDVAGTLVTAVAVGAAVGVDNLRASAGLGLVSPLRARRVLIVSLILADAIALVIGAMVGLALPREVDRAASMAGVVVLAILAAIALLGWPDDGPEALIARPEMTVGLPILLSLDNLAAGAAVVAIGYPAVPTIPVAAAVAATLCLVGFVLGARLRTIAALPAKRLGGVFLSIAAALAILDLR